MYRALLAAVVLLTLATSPVRAVPVEPAIGVWTNPRNSLDVQTAPCGAKLCGTIVRANDEAQADARDAGVPRLIGLALLRDYRPVDRRTWRGRVYVPDMGRDFSSKIEQVTPDSLKISGCLIGLFFCRSQLWRRVK